MCTHIVDAIRKEAVAMRDEWEKSVRKTDASTNCNGTVTPTDSYCFEMLSMVSALSGSNVGRSYLADQHDLLSNLLSLLHTGSARVQRQVSVFRFRRFTRVIRAPPSRASRTPIIANIDQLPNVKYENQFPKYPPDQTRAYNNIVAFSYIVITHTPKLTVSK